MPKIDRPNLPDGNELIVRFSCAFPWDVESDSTDNEQRIILEDGSDNNDGIEDLETGIAAAALVIGLSVALAWLVKNHRERKEMMEITEKAIKQHLSSSDKKNTKDNFVDLNRNQRKEKERWRMGTTFDSTLYQIKIADMLDNQHSINKYDPSFAKTFNAEYLLFLEHAVNHFGEKGLEFHIAELMYGYHCVDSMASIYDHKFLGLIEPIISVDLLEANNE